MMPLYPPKAVPAALQFANLHKIIIKCVEYVLVYVTLSIMLKMFTQLWVDSL